MGDHEVWAEAVAKDLDALAREPITITKKLSEIIAENPELRVTGIYRQSARCVKGWVWPDDQYASLAMRWHAEWHAWSCRPDVGIYQQIIIFVPREADE